MNNRLWPALAFLATGLVVGTAIWAHRAATHGTVDDQGATLEQLQAKDKQLKALRTTHAQTAERMCVEGTPLEERLDALEAEYAEAGGDADELRAATVGWLGGRADDFRREAALNEREGKTEEASGVRRWEAACRALAGRLRR